jgi:two-component sensor histidine kinase
MQNIAAFLPALMSAGSGLLFYEMHPQGIAFYGDITGITGLEQFRVEKALQSRTEYIHPEDQAALLQAAESMPHIVEYRLRQPGGAWRWIRETIVESSKDMHRGILQKSDTEHAVQSGYKHIHHRVKNHLQLIVSMLNLQSGSINNPDDQGLLLQSSQRIRIIALLHEYIYRSGHTEMLILQDYLQMICRAIVPAMDTAKNPEILLSSGAEPILLPTDMAMSCGLLLNEILCLLAEHSAVEELQIQLSPGPAAEYCCSISINIPAHITPALLHQRSDFAGTLIQLLLDQTDGIVEMQSGADGTTYILLFKDFKQKL